MFPLKACFSPSLSSRAIQGEISKHISERAKRNNHRPLEHNAPTLDLFVRPASQIAQLDPPFSSPHIGIPVKDTRIAEVCLFDDGFCI